MARLNIKQQGGQVRGKARSPLTTAQTATAVTGEGAPAYRHEDKSALFLLATGRFFGENSFYETAHRGAERFRSLARTVAVQDPDWFKGFTRWLRNDGNIRTGAIVAAAEGAAAWQKAKITGTRDLVRSVLVRADEPGEFLAYWRTHIRRSVAGGVKRAVADAVNDLYNERNVIKWDSDARGYRFADVIEIVRPQPSGLAELERLPADRLEEMGTVGTAGYEQSVVARKAQLWKYLLDQRHHGDGQLDNLPILSWYKERQRQLAEDRTGALALFTANPDLLKQAGMTWENLSSSGPMDRAAWEAIIPNMGYMALLRNLRNFDQSGVSAQVKAQVAARLSSQTAVLNSRQLPYRFLSAYTEAQGHEWQAALETALQFSLPNIPVLDGKTVVLVDTSGSMGATLSQNSKVTYAMAGALFGTALAAAQGNAELIGFADGVRPYRQQVTRGASVLRLTQEFVSHIGHDGYGTNINAAVRWAMQYNPTRIVIVTDGQCNFGDVSRAAPPNIPVYAFNLVGYGATAIQSGTNRHQLGGLTDHTFALIKNIEAAQTGTWPWETGA